MNDTMTVGLLSLAGALAGSISGILTANRLTNYRIAELEKKVDQHNVLVERTTIVERDLKSAWRAICPHLQLSSPARLIYHCSPAELNKNTIPTHRVFVGRKSPRLRQNKSS